MTRKPDQRALKRQGKQHDQPKPESKEGETVDIATSPADVLRKLMIDSKDPGIKANAARALSQIEARAGYGVNKPLHRMSRSELTSAIARVEALIATQGIDKLS